MRSTKICSVLGAAGLTLAACGFAGAPATHAARPTARPADTTPLAAAVQAAGVGQVQQVGGGDPYQTAAAVAGMLQRVTGQQTFSSVCITSAAQANVVDALSGGAPAAMFPAPILLAPPAQDGQTALPPSEAPYAQGAKRAGWAPPLSPLSLQGERGDSSSKG